MRKIWLAAVAATSLLAVSTLGASAAPSHSVVDLRAAPAHTMVTDVDYGWHRHHYHHRRWDHGHWRYWD